MADFEDAHSPTWEAPLDGQINLRDAIRHAIESRALKAALSMNEKVPTAGQTARWASAEKHI